MPPGFTLGATFKFHQDAARMVDDAKYEAITLDQIKVVAAKYLKPETAVIVTVKPGK